MNRLQALKTHGQSVWLDYIRRDLLAGGLQKLIAEDGLAGLTSNPAIFEKAIAGSTLYDAALKTLVQGGERDPERLVEALAIADLQQAADQFQGVYQASHWQDGYVSLEVSPRLANDTAGTLAAARRLWAAMARANTMIKVPGTAAGLPAIRTLIAEGINVNITLLFSRSAYREVALAYLDGLEDLAARGGDLRRVASVASFFVSRIDSAMDARISAHDNLEVHLLLGQTAIANAKLAYHDWQQLMLTQRWQALAEKGAQPQRLLWASTGTKNPAFRDTLYIDSLIGPATVNTVPPATLDAFRDHGHAACTLDADLGAARAALAALERHQLSLSEVTDRLVVEGVQLFVDAWNKLLQAVAAKRDALA